MDKEQERKKKRNQRDRDRRKAETPEKRRKRLAKRNERDRANRRRKRQTTMTNRSIFEVVPIQTDSLISSPVEETNMTVFPTTPMQRGHSVDRNVFADGTSADQIRRIDKHRDKEVEGISRQNVITFPMVATGASPEDLDVTTNNMMELQYYSTFEDARGKVQKPIEETSKATPPTATTSITPIQPQVSDGPARIVANSKAWSCRNVLIPAVAIPLPVMGNLTSPVVHSRNTQESSHREGYLTLAGVPPKEAVISALGSDNHWECYSEHKLPLSSISPGDITFTDRNISFLQSVASARKWHTTLPISSLPNPQLSGATLSTSMATLESLMITDNPLPLPPPEAVISTGSMQPLQHPYLNSFNGEEQRLEKRMSDMTLADSSDPSFDADDPLYSDNPSIGASDEFIEDVEDSFLDWICDDNDTRNFPYT